MAGYAGVGKTTLAKYFAETIDGKVLYAAFTGKAALVMRKNGCWGASTIHSLIYRAEETKLGDVRFVLNRKSPLADASLLIIDECSMVDDKIGLDLLRFNVPILVLGDPAQLPPVNGTGFFTGSEPDVLLTEIHRQAEDNPIIHLATQIRNGVMPKMGEYGSSKIVSDISPEEFMNHEQIIAGRNITRNSLNQMYREELGYTDKLPAPGDRLICLRNNNKLGLFNGGMFRLVNRNKTKSDFYSLLTVMDMDNETNRALKVRVHNSLFDGSARPDWKLLKGTEEFDYGYAITSHKAQGSQWDSVLIFDESHYFRDDKYRWLYTAVTRAQSNVTIYR